MYRGLFEDKQNHKTITGPERKTPKGAVNAVVNMAIEEGHDKPTKITIYDDGLVFLTAHGDTPTQARQEAHDMITRNSRRY